MSPQIVAVLVQDGDATHVRTISVEVEGHTAVAVLVVKHWRHHVRQIAREHSVSLHVGVHG